MISLPSLFLSFSLSSLTFRAALVKNLPSLYFRILILHYLPATLNEMHSQAMTPAEVLLSVPVPAFLVASCLSQDGSLSVFRGKKGERRRQRRAQ